MTPTELQTKHPETYAAILADERDRVAAHLKASAASGLTDLAFAAIVDGRSFEDCAAQYTTAVRNRRDQAVHLLEAQAAADVTADLDASPNAETGDDSYGMSVARRVEVLLGIDPVKAAKRRAERAAGLK